MTAEAIVFGFLALSIICVELWRHKEAPYDVLTLFNLSYFVYFVIAPMHIIYGGEAFTRQVWIYRLAGSGGTESALWILVSYWLVLIGYWAFPSYRSPLYGIELRQMAWLSTGIFCVVIGLGALLSYAHAVGGMGTAITQSSFIRQGTYQVSGPLLFLKHLVPLVIAGMMIIFAWRLDREWRTNGQKSVMRRWIWFLAATILFVGLVVSGRRAILFPIVVLFLLFSNLSGKANVGRATVIVSGAILVLAFWDAVGWGLRDQQWETYFSSRMSSFGIVYAIAFRPLTDTFMHWVGIFGQSYEVWGFKDWLYLPLYILPASLTSGIDAPSVVETTTMMLKGRQLSETAGEPPGFHGYFYISGGVLGIVIGSLVYGCLLRVAHVLFLPRGKSVKEWLIYVWISLGAVYFVRHGMIEFVITERFHWWMALGMLSMLGMIFGIRVRRSSVAWSLDRTRRHESGK